MNSNFLRDKISSIKQRSYKLNRRFIFLLIPLVLLLVLLVAAVPGALQREHRYREANALMQDGDLKAAKKIFETLPYYKDSSTLLEKEIPYIQANNLYDSAVSEEGSESAVKISLFQAAADAFHDLGDYKDSADMEMTCLAGIDEENIRQEEAARALKQAEYDEAVSVLEAGEYSEAVSRFRALGSFENSSDMASEAIYRKAVSIFQFLKQYDVSHIYAYLTVEKGETSIFSLSVDEALRLGSACVDELRSVCGADRSDVRLEDEPGPQLVLLKDALTDMFISLGDYGDSSEYPDMISAETDYTRDFFMLCSTGDLHAAKTWLNEFTGDFPEREKWAELLELYLPYCGTWELYLGDSALLAYTLGQSFTSMNVSSRVILTQDNALLRLSFGDGYSYNFDLPSALGETLFINTEVDSGIYMAAVNNGHFVYLLYNSDWKLISSCDYSPA